MNTKERPIVGNKQTQSGICLLDYVNVKIKRAGEKKDEEAVYSGGTKDACIDTCNDKGRVNLMEVWKRTPSYRYDDLDPMELCDPRHQGYIEQVGFVDKDSGLSVVLSFDEWNNQGRMDSLEVERTTRYK